jgi:type I restriction enzyme S subunit
MKRPKSMTINTTPTRPPNLRFPEFGNSTAAEFKPLREVFGRITNGKANAEDHEDDGQYPLFDRSDTIKRSSNFMFDAEAVIVPGEGARFHPRHFKGKFNLHQRAYALMQCNGNARFMFYSIDHMKDLLAKNAVKSTVLSLRLPIIESFDVWVPSEAEQQKIAEFLSSLDELIGAESQKLDALKAYKTGLMQQLFPREGETLPRLRFPEFRTASAWQRKPLGELMPITSSRRVHESEWSDDGVEFYRARELVALSKGEAIAPLHISEELYRINIGLSGEIRSGHLLVTGVGSIGVPYLVKAGDRFYFKDGNIIWLKNDQSELIGELLLCLFQTDHVQDQIRRMADVGTVATYTIDNARKTFVAFPENKLEQLRIASCVAAISDLVATQSQKLQALQTQKQGLMQQLFPSLVAAEA